MNRRFTTNLHKNKALQEPPGIYRHCRLGHTLVDAVGEMAKAKKITAFLESHIMSEFDRRVARILEESSRREKRSMPQVCFTGKKQDHTFIDGSWEIHLENVDFYDLAGERAVRVQKLVLLAENWTDKSVQRRKNMKGLVKTK